jgi:ABC-2 type transport system permease protein
MFLIQKEFLQVFRNRTILPLIFVLPIVQLLILVNAATMDMKNLRIVVCDHDNSPISRRIIGEVDASPFFILKDQVLLVDEALARVENGTADLVLVLPKGLEKDVTQNISATIQLLANAINAQQAQLGYGYLQQVVSRFGANLMLENYGFEAASNISVTSSYWFNPELNYKHFMLPGILTILISIIGLFLSSMNLVREKEMGTIEQINVTPVRKYQFIAAKLIPFWIIGLIELTLGILVGRLLYALPIEGSLMLIYGVASIYLIGLLGMGLLISTFSKTQQQVAFISYFFLLIFILMSGIFTSADNMPVLAQQFNVINPVYYFIDVMRSVMLKGSRFDDLLPQITALSLFALTLVSLAVFNYRKRV